MIDAYEIWYPQNNFSTAWLMTMLVNILTKVELIIQAHAKEGKYHRRAEFMNSLWCLGKFLPKKKKHWHTSRLGTLTLLEIQLLLVDTQYCADFEDTMTKAVFVEV